MGGRSRRAETGGPSLTITAAPEALAPRAVCGDPATPRPSRVGLAGATGGEGGSRPFKRSGEGAERRAPSAEQVRRAEREPPNRFFFSPSRNTRNRHSIRTFFVRRVPSHGPTGVTPRFLIDRRRKPMKSGPTARRQLSICTAERCLRAAIARPRPNVNHACINMRSMHWLATPVWGPGLGSTNTSAYLHRRGRSA